MKKVVSVLLTLLLTSPAQAQLAPQPLLEAPAAEQDNQGSDITRIIRDILGEDAFPPPPGQPVQTQSAGIDNIPVSVEIAPDAAFEGEWLVVSAYSPPRANGSQDKGELLGETRLLLRGLTPPFKIVVAAPTAVTMGLEFAQIRGRIEDSNGNAVLTSPEYGLYRGAEAASLMLQAKPRQLGAQLPPETIVKFERAQGRVDITDPGALFRGAVLTVQLTEKGLAGGMSQSIKGETRLQIDGQTPPFNFTLDYGVPEDGFKMPLELSAFITDWAGRKTHVMAKTLEFNGPDYDYRVKLDAFKQGRDVANFQFTQAENAAQTEIKGQAIFNAYKGLPLGSYLKIRLRSPLSANQEPREISTTAVSLNGISGNVDFTASAPSINFDPELPAPLIDLAIVNPSGNVMFESGSSPVSETAINLITLSPRPIY